MVAGGAAGGSGDDHGADGAARKEALEGGAGGATSSFHQKRHFDSANLYEHGYITPEPDSEVEVKTPNPGSCI